LHSLHTPSTPLVIFSATHLLASVLPSFLALLPLLVTLVVLGGLCGVVGTTDAFGGVGSLLLISSGGSSKGGGGDFFVGGDPIGSGGCFAIPSG
jgi:hypothetical protein